jgi:hypothetical protein
VPVLSAGKVGIAPSPASSIGIGIGIGIEKLGLSLVFEASTWTRQKLALADGRRRRGCGSRS